MGALGQYLVGMLDPLKKMERVEKQKQMAQKTLSDLNEAIARGEADIERSMKDSSIDPNVIMQKKQALDSFKEHMYYDEKSPYRQAYLTLYGYPPEKSPSMQPAMIRGKEGARMVNLPSRPMLPKEEAGKEKAMAETMAQQTRRETEGLKGRLARGERPPMTPEQRALTVGGETGTIVSGPGLGVGRIPYGSKEMERIVPLYAKGDQTSALINAIRLNQEQRAQEDQEAQMLTDANKAVNETIASLVENQMFSAEEVGGVKGGGIGRVIVDDPDLRNQIKSAFDATPYAQKYGMTLDFVEASPKEVAVWGLPMAILGKKKVSYVRIALVPQGKEGKVKKSTTPKSSVEKEQKEVLGGTTRGF